MVSMRSHAAPRAVVLARVRRVVRVARAALEDAPHRDGQPPTGGHHPADQEHGAGGDEQVDGVAHRGGPTILNARLDDTGDPFQ